MRSESACQDGVTEVDPSTTHQTAVSVDPDARISLLFVVSHTINPSYLPTVFIADVLSAMFAAVTDAVLIIAHDASVNGMLVLKQNMWPKT